MSAAAISFSPHPGTSPASATRRPRIAAAFPVSTRHSTLPLTPNTRTTPKPRNGSTITIPTSSTSCRSNTPSAASRTSATLPRLASPRTNHRQLPADQPMCIGPRPPPDGYAHGGLAATLFWTLPVQAADDVTELLVQVEEQLEQRQRQMEQSKPPVEQ